MIQMYHKRNAGDDYMKINWKNILVLTLMVFIGFAAGIGITLKIVNEKLVKYNIEMKIFQ